MSKNRDFSDTSASRYSLALYELAEENKSLDEIESQANMFLVLITNSEDFASLIKDPTNKKEDLINVINALSNKFRLNSLLTKFINFSRVALGLIVNSFNCIHAEILTISTTFFG